MRIVVHDYSGHPFQVELSRELARRGHDVLHLHFEGFLTPKGNLSKNDGDTASLSIKGLTLDRPFQKYALWRRRHQEVAYGKLAAREILAFKPDLVLASNVPLDALEITESACRSAGIRFVFWLQDIYSEGISRILRRKLPLIGAGIGWFYRRKEAAVLRHSDHVICITEDFLPIIGSWGVDLDKCHVIENWAPLDAIVPLEQSNPWSREQGLAGKKVLLYAGTLGFKHDPRLLLDLACQVETDPDTRVVVISEGEVADWLRREASAKGLTKLIILPFQEFSRFSEVLASATVLLALIEPDAGVFSVPSKVLSYLAAGRPLLLSVPNENLASKRVREAEAGLVVAPGDKAAFAAGSTRLLEDETLRRRLADNGRAHAEAHFDIGRVADRFEAAWASSASGINPKSTH